MDLFSLITSSLERRGSVRMIYRRNPDTGKIEPYLKRYYLVRSKNFGVYIHQFWSSDPDHLHSHPWHNANLILRGGYYEHFLDGTTYWRGPGCFRFRQAEVFHRITIKEPGIGWSLFARFKTNKAWGFLTPKGWIEAKKYGEITDAPVDVEGVDFRLRGWFLPIVEDLHDKKPQ